MCVANYAKKDLRLSVGTAEGDILGGETDPLMSTEISRRKIEGYPVFVEINFN